jgi:hypothetical protein
MRRCVLSCIVVCGNGFARVSRRPERCAPRRGKCTLGHVVLLRRALTGLVRMYISLSCVSSLCTALTFAGL